MKSKIKLLIITLSIFLIQLIGNKTLAQTVSGTTSTNGCNGGGTITAASTGLGATPQYQLLLSGSPIAPVVGDTNQYTNNNVFTGLLSGIYTLKGRTSASGTVYTSTNITVSNGYTAMTVNTPTATTPCTTGMIALTTTVTGGRANYVYSIKNIATNAVMETSVAKSATTHTFAALPVGSYLVSVTDNCGTTITGATSITQSGVLIGGILPAGLVLNRITNGSCAAKIRINTFYGLGYDTTGTRPATATDKANFTWRLEFNGQSYGQDIDADGNPDLAGPDFPGTTTFSTLPGGITDRTLALAGNPKYILKDKCGNSAAYTPTTTFFNYRAVNCGGVGQLAIQNANLGGNLACYPINFTFTNTTNPADVILYSLTSASGQVPNSFVVGKTYNISYVDASGGTTGFSGSNSIAFSPTANNYTVGGLNKSILAYNSFNLGITVNNGFVGDVIKATIISSTVSSTVGLTSSSTLTANGVNNLGFTPTPYSSNTLPAGTYTVQFSGPCGTYNQTFSAIGYIGVLSSLSTTPVCGGFNVIGNTASVEDASFYEIVIVSGPSNVGAVRNLANTTTSLPFNGLSYGTYVFGIRPKSGSIFNTQTVTYDASSTITIDKSNTGGYICSAGSTNGVLNIAASSASPAPGNVLSYALSLDGGTTYGAYQSANTFSGLASGTYLFKVKDACGNEVTNSAQIGVAASPVASVNGMPNTATFCAGEAGSTITLSLDVNIPTAIYNWTGPTGVFSNISSDPNYKGLKNPIIALTSLSVGNNAITCTITLGAPCNSTSTGNLNIIIQPLPTLVIVNPAAVCNGSTVNLTAPTVTAGSDSGLAYTYFTDAAATAILPNPSAVGISGTYYIKATNSNSCSTLKPVRVTINTCTCTQLPATGTPNAYTKVGITVQQKQAGWPENIPNGFIALESKEKGFVITRVQNEGQISDPKTGMIMYDITAKCVKLYNGSTWNCIKKSCNN
ncbi:hypothetical protein GCM10023210_32690 [Chryseobacterium ginsengisoli]|uniref:Ig-like domain-containing protein n=1 Tax=Chryseobacterium ginsengisoli TaxID=363853 RepID=A0ABP9ML23_9FLAO